MSSSLWFVPAIMVLASVVAAAGLVEIDTLLAADLASRWPRLLGAAAEGARGILAAIATSMMTVAGVVFSVTLVALSLASTQYSPRVLRTFMGDRTTQVVLGVFVSVFAYCLVVLRTIRGADDPFVPSLAVLGGIVLALTAVGFLVFFIHHIATTIEVSSILARVTAGTIAAVDVLFPQEMGEGEEEEKAAQQTLAAIETWTPVPSAQSGYIVSLYSDGLLAFARERRRVVCMERAIGEFVIEGQPLLWLSGAEPIDAQACEGLNALYAMDRERTLEQDAAFGIRQIVDIALKALSPGINDQTTAVSCIDRLAEILTHLAGRHAESPYRRDGEALRVVALGPSFTELTARSFEDIRECAGGKRTVLLRMLWALERIGAAVRTPEQARVLAAQARAIGQAAERALASPVERAEVHGAAEQLASALAQPGTARSPAAAAR